MTYAIRLDEEEEFSYLSTAPAGDWCELGPDVREFDTAEDADRVLQDMRGIGQADERASVVQLQDGKWKYHDSESICLCEGCTSKD